MNRPFVIISLGWITGSLICYWWYQNLFLYICLGVGSVIVGGCLYYWYRKGLLISLFIIGLAVGAIRFTYVEQMNQSHIGQLVNGESWQGVIIGKIASLPQVDGDQLMFQLQVKQIQQGHVIRSIGNELVQVSVHLQNEQEWKQAKRFERYWQVSLPIILEPPSPARNPGAFDYQEYLYRQQIHWLGKVDGLQQIRVISRKNNHLFSWMDQVRGFLGEKINQIYPSEHAGLMRAMLLGERKALDAEMEEGYRELGIVHLLSISGLNVGIFVICLYLIFKWLGLTREKAALFIIAFLPLYVLLTGAEAPVIRAALMAGMACVAMVLDRFQDTISFMALSLCVQLWWNPYQLMEAGFQLSYLITAALIVMVPPLVEQLPFRFHGLKQAAAVTWVAQIASFPILIWHFHEFSFISWFANLLIVPIISSLVVPMGMLALLLSLLSESLGIWLAKPSSLLIEAVHIGVEWMTPFSWAQSTWVPPHWIWISLYCLLVYLTWVSWITDHPHRARFRLITSIGLVIWLILVHQLWRLMLLMCARKGHFNKSLGGASVGFGHDLTYHHPTHLNGKPEGDNSMLGKP